MNRLSKLALLVSAGIVLGGCASPVPVAQNFPMTTQQVARTAHHWDVIAQDVVGQTRQSMAGIPQLKGRGVFVATSGGSAFENALRDFLITRYVGEGESVSVCKRGQSKKPGFDLDPPDVEIQYRTQFIRHGDRLPHYQPGVLTALAAGVAVIRNWDPTAATIGGLAALELGAGHLASPTSSEVIVTTTIAEGNRFLMRKTDVYYVPDADASLFLRKVAQQPLCADEKPGLSANAGQTTENEYAVRQLIERDMRRFNPGWSGGGGVAYSY